MNDIEQIECDDKQKQLIRLRAIMHRLRSDGGCSWDAEQTHESLIPCLIEEAYEVVHAIREKDTRNLKEELGDLLLQVVFHSEIAAESGLFDFDDVAQEIADKLIRRHPHVYATPTDISKGSVLIQWEEIKKAEKTARGEKNSSFYLDGVGEGLPAILKAEKIQKKAAKVGFDWKNASAVIEKIEEEFIELKEELAKIEEDSTPHEALKDEIGDLLFVIINLSRKLKLNPEELIDRTNQKFLRRFKEVEKGLGEQGLKLAKENSQQMEKLWNEQRKKEKKEDET